MARDNVTKSVREKVADIVGFRCSNPQCQKLTSGPAIDTTRAINIGEAAHITAASPGGPRYDRTLSPDQRSSINNAIWLCGACATMIDRDTERFTVKVLREFREQAESAAAVALAAGSKYRAISASEVLQEFTVGQLVAIRALEEEFGCHVEMELKVPDSDGGWIWLDAAVVHAEDLVAIDIRENTHGKGIPYFQIEYLLELCGKLKFKRFHGCIVYIRSEERRVGKEC